jgi:hypothetical protein
MGIRFSCPNGHALHVKEFLAGKRGICPSCGAKFVIPAATEPTELVAVTAPVDTASVQGPGDGMQSGERSVVIETLAASVPHPATAQVQQSGSQPAQVIGPAEAAPIVEPALSAPTRADGPASPAVKYIAQRERARRNRTRLAILLLVTVIALAVVLVWTLAVGSGALGRKQPNPAFPGLTCPPLAHFSFSHSFTARLERP